MRFVTIMILLEIVRYITITDEICYNYDLVRDCSLHNYYR